MRGRCRSWTIGPVNPQVQSNSYKEKAPDRRVRPVSPSRVPPDPRLGGPWRPTARPAATPRGRRGPAGAGAGSPPPSSGGGCGARDGLGGGTPGRHMARLDGHPSSWDASGSTPTSLASGRCLSRKMPKCQTVANGPETTQVFRSGMTLSKFPGKKSKTLKLVNAGLHFMGVDQLGSASATCCHSGDYGLQA